MASKNDLKRKSCPKKCQKKKNFYSKILNIQELYLLQIIFTIHNLNYILKLVPTYNEVYKLIFYKLKLMNNQRKNISNK